MDIKEVLFQWFIKFLIETSCSGNKNENIPNKVLAKELHKPIIRKFNKEKYTHLLLTIFGVQILQICN